MCPRKGAFVLSDGIISEDRSSSSPFVSCPLHNRDYSLTADKDAESVSTTMLSALRLSLSKLVEMRSDSNYHPRMNWTLCRRHQEGESKKNEVPDKLALLDKFITKTKIKFANITEGVCRDNKLDW